MPKKKKNQLESGRFRKQIFVGVRKDGTKRYESITADTLAEADLLAKQYKAKCRDLIKQGRKTEDIPKPNEEEKTAKPTGPTLGDAMDEYIETCRAQDYSPSTIACYVSMRSNAFPELVKMPVCSVTLQDVQNAVNIRTQAKTPKTVRSNFAFTKRVLAIYRPDLSLANVILPKNKKKKKIIFKRQWGLNILKYAREHECTDYYLYCSFIISTGLRPSEIYALKWSDISAKPITVSVEDKIFQYGTVRIDEAEVRDEFGVYTSKNPKTEAGNRVQTIDWAFFNDLYSVKPRQADDKKLFRLNPHGIQERWVRTKKVLKLPEDLRFYDMRHMYATTVATSGATEDELAFRMGHSTAAFSHSVYVELFEDRQESINAVLATATKDLYSSISEEISHEISHET